MQQPATIDDYLAYNPPRPIVTKKHTSHKTTFPSNPHMDNIELTEWESFADDALCYADGIRQGPLAAHPMPPLPTVDTVLPYMSSETDMYALVAEYVKRPLERICGAVFDQKITVKSVAGLLSLNSDAGIVCFHTAETVEAFAYCTIEYKTPYAFTPVDDGDLVAAFNAERSRQRADPARMQTRQSSSPQPEDTMTKLSTSDETKVSRVIAQLWAYMTVNHLKYGILTTINDTYFFRRVQHQVGTTSKLEVSLCVNSGNGRVPFLTAWLYLISLAVESHTYTSPYSSPAFLRKSIKTDDPYTVQDITLSAIRFTHAGPLSTSVAQVAIGSSKNSLIVHVKFFDVSKDRLASEKFHRELEAYKKLESLQSSLVPKLYGSFLASGFLYGLFLEPCGQPITQQLFDRHKSDIKALLKQIHSLGVAHGDVACRNILINGNSIRLIDFDHCSLLDGNDDASWNENVMTDLDACQ